MAIKLWPSFTPKSFLAKVGEDRSIGKYRKTMIVFSQGDPADGVFHIQKSKAKITVISEQSKEAVVAFLGTNDFFGKGCLAGQLLRMASVATITDSVVVRLEKAAIVRVTSVVRDVHRPSCGTDNPRRSRPRRSAVQFERQQSFIRYNGHTTVQHDEPHIEA
jgi:signal-transduction protein with cAMP-binding, CBS, and nucleotidyltransferase domain